MFLGLRLKEMMELTHLLLALPFHIERSWKINNQYIVADEAGNGKHRTRLHGLFNHIYM